jgi:acyl carrier protein
VRIGDGVRLGGFVMIMDTDYHDRRDFHAPSPSLPVIIEDGARLGRNVTVLKGAHIGPGAWIGPGSVVSGTVPPGACASGVPARVFRGAAGATGGPSSFLGEGDPGLLDRVRAVVAETFHVGLPDPADGPSQIPAWDSLGTLRLLLGLEEAFGVVLPEALGDAGNVRDRALAYRDAER